MIDQFGLIIFDDRVIDPCADLTAMEKVTILDFKERSNDTRLGVADIEDMRNAPVIEKFAISNSPLVVWLLYNCASGL